MSDLPTIETTFTLSTVLGEREFQHFLPKSGNHGKILFVAGGTESCWACFSDKDIDEWAFDATDPDEVIRVAILRNSSLSGLPWGAYVPFRFKDGEAVACPEVMVSGPVLLNEHETVESEERPRPQAPVLARGFPEYLRPGGLFAHGDGSLAARWERLGGDGWVEGLIRVIQNESPTRLVQLSALISDGLDERGGRPAGDSIEELEAFVRQKEQDPEWADTSWLDEWVFELRYRKSIASEAKQQ